MVQLVFQWGICNIHYIIVSKAYFDTCIHLCCLSGDGVDYGPITCNPLMFSGTDDQQCCDIPINDDNLVEGTENFTVSLNSTSSNANLTAPTQATVSIADNDSEFVHNLSVPTTVNIYAMSCVVY